MARKPASPPADGAREDSAAGGSEVVLRLRGIRKTFGPLVANNDITLDLHKGEVLALLGENGAGKTTLMSILFGHYVADSGEIEAFGKKLATGSPRAAIDAGIGMVHQHFTLADNLSVLDNIVLGTTSLTSLFLNRGAARRRLAEVSRRTGLKIDPDSMVADLTVGERQRVEILKALYRGARILILDEPTAVLTPQETEQLFTTVRDLVSGGMSVIFISHKLKEVMNISDRVVVLRQGSAVFTADIADTSARQLASEMVGREVDAPASTGRGSPGVAVLELSRVNVRGTDGRTLLSQASLQVRRNEIVGVAGVSGNGQQALFRVISGLDTPTAGSIRILDTGHVADPTALVGRGVARIPEDRHAMGLIADMLVWENLISERYRTAQFQRAGIIRRADAIENAKASIAEFDIRCPSPVAVTRLLSGGNMQKLILARTLSRDPGFIIANQPTRGLDVGAVAFVHRRLLDAAASGAGVLLISEDLDELLQLSDRIVVMSAGKISMPVDRADASVPALGLMMTGEFEEARGAV